MRWNETRFAFLILAGLALAVPGAANADVDLGGATLSGRAELGARTVTGDFNSAKWDEYRDLRPGLFGDLEFLLEDGAQDDYLRGWLTHIGEADERYELEAGRWGLGRLRLFYGELPVPLSNQARSPYRGSSEDLRLPPSFQRRVSSFGGALQSSVLRSELSPTPSQSLGYTLRKGEGDFSFQPMPGLELAAGYTQWDRRGTKPLGLGFGSPGGNFVTVAQPIKEQIHEVTSAVRLARDIWNLEFEYIGSWFENDYDALRVDNPLRAVDGSAGARGQISTNPDNVAHNFQLTGSVALPVAIPARLTVTGAYGVREQDEDFLPHTINRQARGLPMANLLGLPQDSLDGNVDTWLANVFFTAEPFENVDFDARYRYYRLSNDTDDLAFPAHVVNDQGSISVDTLIADPLSYSRHNADASVGVQVADPVRVEVGYAFERWSRDESRNVRESDEHGGHVAVDVVAGPSFRMNARYELGVRRKDRYDPFASLENMHDIAELTDDDRLNFQFPELRKYSQADRIRQDFALIGTWLPVDTLDVTLSLNWTQNDYDNTDYGIKDHEAYSAGIDVGYQPTQWLRLFGGYSYEVSEYRMRGRWRPRSFAPPTTPVDDFLNDWSTDSEDRAHFFNMGGTIGVIPDRLELEFAYLLQDAQAETRSQDRNGLLAARPPTTGGDGGNAPSWPDIEDVYQMFQAIARYRVNDRWTLKGGWRWEKFQTTNFKLDDLDPFEPRSNINGSGMISPSTDIFLGNRLGDYDAHLFMLSVEFNF